MNDYIDREAAIVAKLKASKTANKRKTVSLTQDQLDYLVSKLKSESRFNKIESRTYFGSSTTPRDRQRNKERQERQSALATKQDQIIEALEQAS